VAYFSFIIEPKTKTRSRRIIEISRKKAHAFIWLAVLVTSLDAGVDAHFMDCRSNPGFDEKPPNTRI
jgi:hypothetical protein